jgi:hypothetical protein
MESERESCLFWLGIESEGGEAEWQALVRQRLDDRRSCDPRPIQIEAIAPAAETELRLTAYLAP